MKKMRSVNHLPLRRCFSQAFYGSETSVLQAPTKNGESSITIRAQRECHRVGAPAKKHDRKSSMRALSTEPESEVTKSPTLRVVTRQRERRETYEFIVRRSRRSVIAPSNRCHVSWTAAAQASFCSEYAGIETAPAPIVTPVVGGRPRVCMDSLLDGGRPPEKRRKCMFLQNILSGLA